MNHMANLPESQLEEEKSQFKSEQLGTIEAYYEHNPEKMLDRAVDIKMITDTTRERIREELGKNHVQIFEAAQVGGRKSFAQAFEAVYGRFFFEDYEGFAEDERTELNRALKFEIDEKTGLKGRSELQVAIRRVDFLKPAGKVLINDKEVEVAGRLKDIEAEAQTLEPEKKSLSEKSALITKAQSGLDQFKISGEIEKMIASLEGKNKKELPNRKVAGMIREVKNKFVSKFVGGNLNPAEWNEFLEVDIGKLLKAMYGLKMAKLVDVIKRLKTLIKDLQNGQEAFKNIVKLDETDDEIEERLRLLEEEQLADKIALNAREKEVHQYFSMLRDKVASLGITSANDYVTKIDSFLGGKIEDLTSSQIDEFIESAHTPFLKSLSGVYAPISSLEIPENIKNSIIEMEVLDATESAVAEKKDVLVKAIDAREDYLKKSQELMGVFENAEDLFLNEARAIKAYFEQQKKQVSEFRAGHGGVLSKEEMEACDKYIKDLDNFLIHDVKTLTPEMVRSFIETSHKPFIEKVAEVLANSKTTNDNSISILDGKLSEANMEIGMLKRLETRPGISLKEVLKQAFGGRKPPEEMKEMERLLAESQSNRTDLDDIYKYVTGKEPASIRSKFEAIAKSTATEESTATAEGIRKAEAALKKAEDNKAKLDGIKTLFSGDKTSALNDIFLEVSALKDFYDQAPSNLEATITSTSSGVDFREKQITAALEASKKKKGMISGVLDKFGGTKEPNIETLRDELAKEKQKLEELKKIKTESDKFKDQAKKVRSELLKYCREYLVAFELGQRPSSPTEAEVKTLKDTLEGMNIDKGFNFADLSTAYNTLKSGFDETSKLVVTRLEEADITIKQKQDVETKKKELEKAKALHADLKVFVEKIKHARSLGLPLSDPKIEENFAKIDVDHMNFTASEVVEFYEKHIEVFVKDGASITAFAKNFENKMVELDKSVKEIKGNLDKAKSAKSLNENLTDSQAAKKIIATLIAQQFPDMSLEDQQKMATAVLAEDVAAIQTSEGYEEFAEQASVDAIATVETVEDSQRLIGFQYKVGEKVEQPFKGLKPIDFSNWANMERLFKTGRLNHENGFFALVAFELLGKKGSIQHVRTAQTLKKLLAEQLGVDERMDEAGISKIVDKAFNAQLEKVRPLVTAYFEHYNRNHEEWNDHTLRAIKLKIEALNVERNLGKINEDVYGLRYKKLIEDAKDAGVLENLGFAHDAAMASFVNSPFAQWFRDRGYDLKERAIKKGKGLAWSTTKLGASATWGLTKFGVRVATLPVRIPAKLAARLGVGFVNLFRANKWQPAFLQKQTQAEAKSVLERAKEVGTKVVETYTEDWKARTHEPTKLEGRIKRSSEDLGKEAEEYAKKGEATPVETTSPLINLDKYKKEIEQLDKIVNGPGNAEGGKAAA